MFVQPHRKLYLFFRHVAHVGIRDLIQHVGIDDLEVMTVSKINFQEVEQ